MNFSDLPSWLSLSQRPPLWKPAKVFMRPIPYGALSNPTPPEPIPDDQFLNGIIPSEMQVMGASKDDVLAEVSGMVDVLHAEYPNAQIVIGYRGADTLLDSVVQIAAQHFVLPVSVTAFDGDAVHSALSSTNYVTIKE